MGEQIIPGNISQKTSTEPKTQHNQQFLHC